MVESRCARFPELPPLTVSIGVAEFPSCATTVYALLDAADHALSLPHSKRATIARYWPGGSMSQGTLCAVS